MSDKITTIPITITVWSHEASEDQYGKKSYLSVTDASGDRKFKKAKKVYYDSTGNPLTGPAGESELNAMQYCRVFKVNVGDKGDARGVLRGDGKDLANRGRCRPDWAQFEVVQTGKGRTTCVGVIWTNFEGDRRQCPRWADVTIDGTYTREPKGSEISPEVELSNAKLKEVILEDTAKQWHDKYVEEAEKVEILHQRDKENMAKIEEQAEIIATIADSGIGVLEKVALPFLKKLAAGDFWDDVEEQASNILSQIKTTK